MKSHRWTAITAVGLITTFLSTFMTRRPQLCLVLTRVRYLVSVNVQCLCVSEDTMCVRAPMKSGETSQSSRLLEAIRQSRAKRHGKDGAAADTHTSRYTDKTRSARRTSPCPVWYEEIPTTWENVLVSVLFSVCACEVWIVQFDEAREPDNDVCSGCRWPSARCSLAPSTASWHISQTIKSSLEKNDGTACFRFAWMLEMRFPLIVSILHLPLC